MTVVSNLLAASKTSPTQQRVKNDIVNCFEHIAMLCLEHMKIGDNLVSFATVSHIKLNSNISTFEHTIVCAKRWIPCRERYIAIYLKENIRTYITTGHNRRPLGTKRC